MLIIVFTVGGMVLPLLVKVIPEKLQYDFSHLSLSPGSWVILKTYKHAVSIGIN